MATQTLTVAQFDDGAAIVSVEYDDITLSVGAVSATVEIGTLTLTLIRQGGQTRNYTVGPGTTRSTQVPNGMQLGVDPETSAVNFSRGNISASFAWSPN